MSEIKRYTPNINTRMGLIHDTESKKDMDFKEVLERLNDHAAALRQAKIDMGDAIIKKICSNCSTHSKIINKNGIKPCEKDCIWDTWSLEIIAAIRAEAAKECTASPSVNNKE